MCIRDRQTAGMDIKMKGKTVIAGILLAGISAGILAGCRNAAASKQEMCIRDSSGPVPDSEPALYHFSAGTQEHSPGDCQ